MLAVVVALAGPGLARGAPARVCVDLASEPAEAWLADALEERIERELARFPQVAAEPKDETAGCPGRAAACLTERYRQRGVLGVVLGRIERERLHWEVYSTAPRQLRAGTIPLDGLGGPGLDRALAQLVDPLVQPGALSPEQAPVGTVDRAVDERGPQAAARPIVLAVLLALAAMPLLFLRRRTARTGARPRTLLPLLLGTGAALAWWLPDPLRALPLSLRAIGVPLAGGLLWGLLVVVALRWIFPPLPSLGRVSGPALFPLLRSWLTLSVLRAIPLAGLAVLGYRFARAGQREALLLALPAAALAALAWLLALADHLAAYLDTRLVDGVASARNPWHATLKRYLIERAARRGAEIAPRLLDQALFLVGRQGGVHSYGGGLTAPRIVVGEAIVHAALGELPDASELERTANPEELPLGTALPRAADSRRKVTTAALRWFARLTLAPPQPRAPAPRRLGLSTSVLGLSLPRPVDSQLTPLSTGERVEARTGQYDAVPERAADDDAVEEDVYSIELDFLFGALVRELASAARGDLPLHTLRLGLTQPGADLPGVALFPLRMLVRGLVALYDRTLARPAAIVGDAAAALNHALHELIQYLSFRQSESKALLTARADATRLTRTSKQILEQVGPGPVGGRILLAPSLKQRIAWLGLFLADAGGARRSRWRRVTAWAAALGVAGLLVARAVQAAILYHPIYQQRMQELAKPRQGAKDAPTPAH